MYLDVVSEYVIYLYYSNKKMSMTLKTYIRQLFDFYIKYKKHHKYFIQLVLTLIFSVYCKLVYMRFRPKFFPFSLCVNNNSCNLWLNWKCGSEPACLWHSLFASCQVMFLKQCLSLWHCNDLKLYSLILVIVCTNHG